MFIGLITLDYDLPLYEEIRQDERRLKAKKEIFLQINGVTYDEWTDYLEWVDNYNEKSSKVKERP